MIKISTVETMALDGGNPSIDFVNSGYAVVPGAIVERLHSYKDLLTLAQRHDFLDPTILQALAQKADQQPEQAASILNEARHLRIAMYHLFQAMADPGSNEIDQQALDTFNGYLAHTLSHRKIGIKGGKPVQEWRTQEGDLQQVLQPYVLCAYEVLTGDQNIFIKQCGGCSWLFLDETKNHRRKWCDMQVCGSSAKAKRYYNKQKQMNKPL